MHSLTEVNQILPEEMLLDESRAAQLVGVNVRTMQQWRRLGNGPRYISISRRCVRYSKRLITEWIAAREVSSTSDSGSDIRESNPSTPVLTPAPAPPATITPVTPVKRGRGRPRKVQVMG